MAQDIDLTSPQWTSLIFEGKNKEYGAYEMRNDSSNRHLKALVIITIVGLAAIYLPNLIHKFIPAPVAVAQQGDINLIDVNLNPVNKDNPVVIQPPAATPSMLKRTIQFPPPVVVPNDKATGNMTTQIELSGTDAVIAATTTPGDPGGTVVPEIEHAITASPPKDEVFIHVEQMPSPQGGVAELMKWLSSNIVYPTVAIEQGIYGTVVLKFVVRPDGSINDVQIVKPLDPNCDKEAIRVVKKMPKWIPGRQNGNAVSVWYTLPVRFKLQNQ